MKTKTYLLLILTFAILSAGAGIGSYYFYRHPIKETITQTINNKVYVSTKTAVDLEFAQLDSISKQPKALGDVYVAGWIPDWDIPNGLQTLKDQPNVFDGISPVWFYMEEDGSLKETPFANGPELSSYISDNNWDLMPSIALFDADTFSKVLNNPENFNRHIEAIVNMTVDNNYLGIDLDYESVYLSDKTLFFNFLSTLSTKLKDKNKKLSFTVLPEWGNTIYYPTLPQTRRVEDYKKIADLVDEFRIMTYDFYGRGSAKAGPVAPLKWMEYVIKYAINEGVPRDKILLGIPTYSYDWSDRPIAPDDIDIINWFGNLTTQIPLENGVAYFNKQVNQVRENYTLNEKYNSVWGEMVGTYNYKGENRIIVFPTEDSLKARKALAAEYGLKGIAYWRIGSEDGLKLQ